jgi:hypothetical protein
MCFDAVGRQGEQRRLSGCSYCLEGGVQSLERGEVTHKLSLAGCALRSWRRHWMRRLGRRAGSGVRWGLERLK